MTVPHVKYPYFIYYTIFRTIIAIFFAGILAIYLIGEKIFSFEQTSGFSSTRLKKSVVLFSIS